MTKTKTGFIGNVHPTATNVSQVYPDTYLKVYTRNHHMQEGDAHQGVLTMVEEDEKFEFHETISECYARNPKVWRGTYLNVHRDKQGHYQVYFRRMELTKHLNPIRMGGA
ncbi:MAG: hypothetical protein J5612_05915, partial [Paludibacteraceae bacterium]|nr:hypothetical protein [Paludibacteraceae bacterium]